MNSILDIKSISKTFSKGKKKNGDTRQFNLIDELDLSIERGKITSLIGGNGTGKTTLFNMISGFLEADQGEITFLNGNKFQLNGMPSHKREQLGIGRLFQDNHIFPDLTVFENMIIAHEDDFGEFPLEILFRTKKSKTLEEQRKEKAKQTFEMLFGSKNVFWEKREHLAKNMSYGQQRLLGLARLFMANYKLVLLDEPTAGVNPKLLDTISEIIKRMVIENDMSVFLIEHNMHFVKQISDICAFINKGKIEIIGTPDEVIANKKVQDSYLGT